MYEDFLREKRKYGLKEVISDEEMKLLSQGMPFQKIIGYVDFASVRINLNHDVLIPRYETEEVLHEALKYIHRDSKVLDLCAGSGCIGLAVKKTKGCKVTLSDISNEAILQIHENAKINHLDVEVIKSDMFENIHQKFDVIISNPPYIPAHVKLAKSVLNYEPALALFGGKDGNDFYKVIIEESKKFLKPSGVLILEISEDNLEFIQSHEFTILKDINNKNRIAIKKFN